ncbi:HAD-IA family hydrolase [Pseudodesulfovibrio sp.]|uniref:HAD family hydrolase n=1 Tax=Pseudodesulfovibrio sp. TaxID=2035812 RepID=UPI002601772E|nr:HAD-IA family hydrolase [Pseudodesulfovibrio sp.]MDD3312239.1 HAD-IA family hydrolase [Pseudodesulfovibrio sp.]
MPGLDAVIFDFDGTLADVPLDFALMKTKIAALGEVFLGERPTPGETPALEWLAELVDRVMAVDEAEGKEFRTRGRLVIAAMELDAARTGRLFDFTRPSLTLLRQHGVATGIITRNISAAVRAVFPDVDGLVDVLIPREEAARVKPHPDHLLAALKRLGARPERSLMVGDHPMDVQTGLNAGSLTAGVTTGRMTAAAFAPLNPTYVVPDVGELMARLQADGRL